MSNVSLVGGLTVQASQTPATGPLAGEPLQLLEQLRASLAGGTLADQIDSIAYKVLTFVASTPQDIDLSTLTDVLGNAITAARARWLAVKFYSKTDNVPLLLSPGTTNGWTGFLGGTTPTLKVFPSTTNNDGFLIIAAPGTTGMPISGTSKILHMDPQTASGQVDLILGISST